MKHICLDVLRCYDDCPVCEKVGRKYRCGMAYRYILPDHIRDGKIPEWCPLPEKELNKEEGTR
jgi:hypothetical protein